MIVGANRIRDRDIGPDCGRTAAGRDSIKMMKCLGYVTRGQECDAARIFGGGRAVVRTYPFENARGSGGPIRCARQDLIENSVPAPSVIIERKRQPMVFIGEPDRTMKSEIPP